MTTLLILLLLLHATSAKNYNLQLDGLLSLGFPNVPEFEATGLMDEVTVFYFDKTMSSAKVTHYWMRELIKNNSQQWDGYTNQLLDSQPVFISVADLLSPFVNQTEELRTLQQIIGCDWNDETDDHDGFVKYGINGEDFIKFEAKTGTWTALDKRAETIKVQWEGDKVFTAQTKFCATTHCITILQLGLSFGKKYLDRKVLPSVSLLQKTPSSPVSCHATGFYPAKGLIYWRKDGEEIHEGVDPGDILPNQDESFQTSVDLNVSSIPPEDWMKYDCVFELTGAQNIIITKLDKDVIRSNHGKTGFFNEDGSLSEVSIIVIAVMAVVILVIIAVLGFMSFKKRRINVMPLRPETPSSDTISL